MTGPTDDELEAAHRVAWVAYSELVRQLQSMLPAEALDSVRRDLRPGGRWAPDVIPTGFGEQREQLLHDVAIQLAELRGEGFEVYYRGAGDILLEVPVDAAGLVDDDDGAP